MSLLSKQAFVARLVGKWQLCSGKSIFNTVDAGIEFTPDGHWYKLQGNATTGFAREQGFDHEGTWTAVDRSSPNSQQPWQLDFSIAGSGALFSGPRFAISTPKMRLDNYAILADYVRIDSPPSGPVWPDLVPSNFVRRVGVQAGFMIDVPADWKGGWFESIWDFEPKGLPSTSQDGNTIAVTVTVEPGGYKSAFAGDKVTSLTIQGRAAITTSPDLTHTFYSVDWSGCAAFAHSCSTPVTQRLIIRVLASTRALWDQYKTLATQAAMTIRVYDGSDPVHGVTSGGSKSNAYVQALARFMDARAEGIGAEDLMCCSAPKDYQTIGLYAAGANDIVSYQARLTGSSPQQPSAGFDVTIHYANGKTSSEHLIVGWESGHSSATVAPKIMSACTGCSP